MIPFKWKKNIKIDLPFTDLVCVAENNRVCLSSVGKLSKMAFIVFSKPISKHLDRNNESQFKKKKMQLII